MRRWAWPVDAGCAVDIEELPDGESSKVLANQESLFRRLAALELERGDPLIAIGDETVLEAATFSAAVWLRGVPLIVVPVTTQGLIDTSIGGKGGINLPGSVATSSGRSTTPPRRSSTSP